MVGEHATIEDELADGSRTETLDNLLSQLQVLSERVGARFYSVMLTPGEVDALIYCIQQHKATRNQ